MQMKEGEYAVFFRNNHFSTVTKNDGELFLLVTDQGYLRESSIVWEKFSQVRNRHDVYELCGCNSLHFLFSVIFRWTGIPCFMMPGFERLFRRSKPQIVGKTIYHLGKNRIGPLLREAALHR